MRLEWEAYFLKMEQKKQNRRQQIKKKHRWFSTMILFVCVLLLGCGMCWYLYNYDAEYVRMEKALKNGDTRLAAVRMSEFLNEKYGEGNCKPEELDVSSWDPTTGRQYMGLQGICKTDPEKRVYLLYLSPKKSVFLDTWQWKEISGALQEEVVGRLGITETMMSSVIPAELSYSKSEYYCPWRQTGAFITRYEGNLEWFFAGEKAAREQLPDLDTLQEEQRLNGSLAVYLKASEVPDMATRVTNPHVLEISLYEREMQMMEEKYQINIFSCVLMGSHYDKLSDALMRKESNKIFPVTYVDYGKNGTFYNPAFTLLSYAYGEAYETRAEEVFSGIWLFSRDKEKELELFQYKECEPVDDMLKAAEFILPGWKLEECFAISGRNKADYVRNTSVIALDMERYRNENVALMQKDYSGWNIIGKNNRYPAGIYHDEYYQEEDGFWILNGSYDENNEMYYGVWSR